MSTRFHPESKSQSNKPTPPPPHHITKTPGQHAIAIASASPCNVMLTSVPSECVPGDGQIDTTTTTQHLHPTRAQHNTRTPPFASMKSPPKKKSFLAFFFRNHPHPSIHPSIPTIDNTLAFPRRPRPRPQPLPLLRLQAPIGLQPSPASHPASEPFRSAGPSGSDPSPPAGSGGRAGERGEGVGRPWVVSNLCSANLS